MTPSPLFLALCLVTASTDSAALSAAPPGTRPTPGPAAATLRIPPDGTGWSDWDNGWGAYGDPCSYGNWDWVARGCPGAPPGAGYRWRWWPG